MKKAQAWSIDLMISVIIFSIGILVFFIYVTNYSGESKEKFLELSYDGEIILKNILSEGVPQNWNESNVENIGILTDNKIDENKLNNFYNMTENGKYNETKKLFNTQFDYYFFLSENITVHNISVPEENISIEGIGKPGITKTTINALDLIKITRLSIYKNKPATVYLYVWRE